MNSERFEDIDAYDYADDADDDIRDMAAQKEDPRGKRPGRDYVKEDDLSGETRGKRRGRHSGKGGSRGVWSWLQWVVLAVILAVLVISGYNFVTEFMTYKKASDEYEKLADMIQAAPETVESAPVKETAATPEQGEDEKPSITYPAMDIDYDGLAKVNDDFVFVLYIPALDLKYPVAHSHDNNEYLHTTFEGTNNPSGCIFLDEAGSEDMSDSNTFIFGHNMKNETMFGSLKEFDKQKDLCATDPYFYLYSKGKVRKYAIFAYYTVRTTDDMYLDFEGGDGYDDYVATAQSRSLFTPEDGVIDWSERPNLVTLSTCWSTGHVYNFIVQGAYLGEADTDA